MRQVRLCLCSTFLLLMLFAVQSAYADQRAAIVVDSDADIVANNGACTLREAILNANNDDQSGSADCAAGNGNDVISFAPSLNNATITLVNGQLTVASGIEVNGLGEANLTISGNNASRIFFVETSGPLSLSNMTLEAGRHSDTASSSGGCIGLNDFVNSGGLFILTNVTLRQCVVNSSTGSANGGAIAANDLTMTNVTLHDNQATGESANGGAVYVHARETNRADVTLNDITAYDNLAQGNDGGAVGGAFRFSNATVNWTDGNVYQNDATNLGDGGSSGGGIGGLQSALNLNDITIHQNQADGGGGLGVSAGSIVADNIVVTENSAQNGAGISLFRPFGRMITNSTIQQNSASYPDGDSFGGGILANIGGDFNLTGTQVISNSADFGAGIRLTPGTSGCQAGAARFYGATIEGNVAAQDGGGLHLTSTNFCEFTIEDTTVRTNRAEDGYGGGIHNALSTTFQGLAPDMTTIRNTTIADNVAAGGSSGGGVANVGFLTIAESTIITGNSASGGGGIYNEHTLFVNDATINQNSALTGAGIANITIVASRGVVTLQNTTLDSNSATLFGGGIASLSTVTNPITVTQSTLSNNSAGSAGGGVYYSNGADGNIANSTLSGNSTNNNGSGVYIANGELTLTNVTVAFGTGNIGLAHLGGTLTIHNSIVALNGGDECSGTITTLGYPNLATDATCNATIVDSNPLLLALQNNGGVTETHDLHPSSPAVDTGNAIVCLSPIVDVVDQRGFGRPHGAGCDLGAVETGSPAPTAVALQHVSTSSTIPLVRLVLPMLVLTLFGTFWLRHTHQ